MKPWRYTVFMLAAIGTISLSLPSPAQAAYIDPGTGSFILQLVAGAVLASLITVKAFWSQVKALVKRPATGKERSEE